MKIIEINSRYYNVPETWNELSGKQLLQVMALLYTKAYSPEKTVLKLLKILTGMSWWAFFRAPLSTKDGYRIRWRNIRPSLGIFIFLNRVVFTGLDEYFYLTEFLLVKNELTAQLLPKYDGFAGPTDEMRNLTMNEFAFSEYFFGQWAEEKDNLSLLNQVVAILYRPKRLFYDQRKNRKGDLRIPFNENLCQYYAKNKVKDWPLHVKMAIVQHYEACRQKWVVDNPEVFNGSGNSEPAQYGLLSVMRGVAKTGIHGSELDDVGKKFVNAIMMELNEMVLEAREQEKALKK